MTTKQATKANTSKTAVKRRKASPKPKTASKARKAPAAKKATPRSSQGAKKVKLLVRKSPHAKGSNRDKKYQCLKSGWTVSKVKETMKSKGLRTPGGYVTYAVTNKIIELQ